MIGQTISHYKVIEKIGRGGKGEVSRDIGGPVRRFPATLSFKESLSRSVSLHLNNSGSRIPQRDG